MFTFKRTLLSVNLASIILCYSAAGHAVTTATQIPANQNNAPDATAAVNKSFIAMSLMYVQPSTNNLKYATFVSGTQPYSQSWHYQEITPTYHPDFELDLNYAIPHSMYSVAANWTRLNSNDSDSKYASNGTNLTTVEFVGPPYEMSPPVFGIKSVTSSVNFDFNNIVLNVGKLFVFTPESQIRIYGGIDILDMNQTITTKFGNYAGSPATPYSYPLPPDPAFSFQTQNVSRYAGAGPALGMSFEYRTHTGLGVMGDILGMLTAGTIKSQDNFTSTSTRLNSVGIGLSQQQITSPNTTQVVLGADAKVGVFYNYQGSGKMPDVTVQLGYRMASFTNAISTVSPNTLVQPGTVFITPEFATGTMAIVSTNSKNSPFNFHGPFLNVKIAVA